MGYFKRNIGLKKFCLRFSETFSQFRVFGGVRGFGVLEMGGSWIEIERGTFPADSFVFCPRLRGTLVSWSVKIN